ncbi:TraB/GumN family protein [Nitrococcus mobilis]|uniref:Pheromone shutdown protein n=1 Tax=Nitrococcus mobilis Nb-231 TaxID=314278 RepID=A4BMM9_9GAMM|nr:TraB/GumN family protein [Nitrococcus mobilis]EAR23567.1 Pheromone shutdown protein [Nitrococcus mobilis Nb-231]
MSEPARAHLSRTITVGDTAFTLLGTAHVSRTSVTEVEDAIACGNFDAVAVELCTQRYRALDEPDALERLDLFQVLRGGKVGLVAASLALAAFQQRLADQFGTRPGAEMEAAIKRADAANLPIWLVDRDISITLKRIYQRIPWWQRFTLLSGLIVSSLSREKITEAEIERLKEGDLLESTFADFAERSALLYETLITERDQYIAARLLQKAQQSQPTNVLVVIGAGHLTGVEAALHEPMADPEATRRTLERTLPKTRWLRWLPWAIVGFIFAGFGLGFARSPTLGMELIVEWVLINGSLAAVGALIAAAHPLTIVTAFLAAPLTSLNPTIGAGFVTAAAEMALRKPLVRHFRTLRSDVTRLRGWWQNRISRTLLVFLFSTLGSAIGTYVAGFRIVERLFY